MTKSKTVTIDTTTVGQHFATIGVVKAGNGRVLHRTTERPYGFTGAAMTAARAWAEDKGYTVVEQDEKK